MFERILDAHQPREREQHVRAFHVVVPTPLVRKRFHHFANPDLGFVQKFAFAGVFVGPKKTGPAVRFKVRRITDPIRVLKMPPSVRFQLRHVNAIPAKS